jgi:hypothetical protein
MTVTIPNPALLTGVRQALAATLTTEFLAEAIDFAPTKLNSQAAANQPTGAVFSLGWTPAQNVNQIVVSFGVQIFDQWSQDWNPLEQSYDPTLVEQWLQRATVALKTNEHALGVWFLRITNAAISDDPAGNPTQAELAVSAMTDNPFGF